MGVIEQSVLETFFQRVLPSAPGEMCVNDLPFKPVVFAYYAQQFPRAATGLILPESCRRQQVSDFFYFQKKGNLDNMDVLFQFLEYSGINIAPSRIRIKGTTRPPLLTACQARISRADRAITSFVQGQRHSFDHGKTDSESRRKTLDLWRYRSHQDLVVCCSVTFSVWMNGVWVSFQDAVGQVVELFPLRIWPSLTTATPSDAVAV